jgi:hypothetical protein
VQAAGGCRGCLAGCGAWVTTGCRVGVLVRGGRGNAIIIVDARWFSPWGNQPADTLRSNRRPIWPPSPAFRWRGRDRQTWIALAIGRPPAGPRSGQWTAAGTPPARPKLLRDPRRQARQFRFTDPPAPRRAGPPENTCPLRPRPFGPHPSRTHFCSLTRNGFGLNSGKGRRVSVSTARVTRDWPG